MIRVLGVSSAIAVFPVGSMPLAREPSFGCDMANSCANEVRAASVPSPVPRYASSFHGMTLAPRR